MNNAPIEFDPDYRRLRLGNLHARAVAVGMASGLAGLALFGLIIAPMLGLIAYGIAYTILRTRFEAGG